MPADCIFPVGPKISHALAAHKKYIKALAGWEDWGRKWNKGARNAELYQLYKEINNFVERCSEGGDWAVGYDNLPDIDEIKEAINYDEESSAYKIFEAELNRKRSRIENNIQNALENYKVILDDAETINEFSQLDWADQIELAQILVSGLNACDPGVAYLLEMLDHSALLLSPQQMLNRAPDFRAEFEAIPWVGEKTETDYLLFLAARRGAQAFSAYFFDYMPAISEWRTTYDTNDLVLRYVSKLWDLSEWITYQVGSLTTVDDGNLVISGIRQKIRQPLQSEGTLAKAIGPTLLVLECVNLYFTYQTFLASTSVPGFRSIADVASDLAGVLTASAELCGDVFTANAARRMIYRLNVGAALFSYYDAMTRAIDARDTWRYGNSGQAAGYIAEGTGLVALGTVQMYCGLKAIALAATPVGLTVVVGACLLMCAGRMIILHCTPTPVEEWLQNTYFGSNWSNVDRQWGPEEDDEDDEKYFKFRRQDNLADIPRQIAALCSITSSVNAYFTYNELTPNHLTLHIDRYEDGPAIAFTAEVAIKLIEIESRQILGAGEVQTYSLITIYQQCMTTTQDGSENLWASYTSDDGTVYLDTWQRDFTFAELSGVNDANFNPQNKWYEIDVIPSGTMSREFRKEPKNDCWTGSVGIHDAVPNVLRKRIRIHL
ncbi:MAG: hypothetical protein GY799_05365 [Desulfobulbaceae bacterium]|nr:hypothetical protein [Desulfobulbaceae bacterium]